MDSIAFEIFGISVKWYGVFVSLGLISMIVFTGFGLKRYKIYNEEHFLGILLSAIVAGIIGARLYYVLFNLGDYQSLWEVINIRNGGLAFHGGIIAGAISIGLYGRWKKLDTIRYLDIIGVGTLLGQAIGRWGNFFNREAFGGYTDWIFAMQIPADEANGVTKDLLLNSYVYKGATYIQVHPTFLYEGVWNLALFTGLMFYRKHKKFHGEIFALYLVGYGIGRTWIEQLRTDQLHIPGTTIAVSQVLSMLLVVIAIAFIIFMRLRIRKNPELAYDYAVEKGKTSIYEELIEDDDQKENQKESRKDDQDEEEQN